MSNFFIVKSGYTPGPQKQSITESNQIRATFGTPTFDYEVVVITGNPGTEPNQIQATFAAPTFDYEPHLVTGNPGAEPNQIQATFALTSFNYA